MADIFDAHRRKLDYSIFKYSSFASNYYPENILEDKSNDQASRWSSETNFPPQFLILKLNSVSIVDTITFGKYEKQHVCNLRKFKIFCGLTEACHMELLESGLKNDSSPETFSIRPMVEGHCVPCRFIKILPLQCWGPSFNFSIWFVELNGIKEWNVVSPYLDWFGEYQENEIIRLCLKHFRQHNYQEAFNALQRQTDIALEDSSITQLHEILVIKGEYQEAESFMERAITELGFTNLPHIMRNNRSLKYKLKLEKSGDLNSLLTKDPVDQQVVALRDTIHDYPGLCLNLRVNEGYFNDFINKQDYRPTWFPMSLEDGEPRPGMRGGHQMCIDSYSGTIYLFGGWDGNQDMSDFWSYNVSSRKWTLISNNTEADGGPSSRSCHKVCLDPERRQIFTLGRYLDTQLRSSDNLKSDFYMYDIESNTWTLISEDTAEMGGPELTFDHQMCIDVAKRTIYVFGGRVLTPPFCANDDRAVSVGLVAATEVRFSGLFSYHIPTSTWKQLFDDSSAPVRPEMGTLKSRVGHSMLFHPGCRKLFIFAGQRSKDYLNDFFTYDVDSGEIKHLCEDTRKDAYNVPASGYTQRATIDPDFNEIYVLSGLSKDKEKRDDNVQNSFWVYSITHNRWSCIYRNENSGEQYWNRMAKVEPCPRFAHQLVYDPVSKVHYLFGGNPGKSCSPKLRLDDFWKLYLVRPSHQQLLQRFKFLIRKHRFEELAVEDSLTALHYLQTCVSEIIDHSDSEQTKQFQRLAAVLFEKQIDSKSEEKEDVRHQRSELFDALVEFFPRSMTQPKDNLCDLVQF